MKIYFTYCLAYNCFLIANSSAWNASFYHIIVKNIHTDMMMQIEFHFLALFHSIWNIMERLREAKNITSYYLHFSRILVYKESRSNVWWDCKKVVGRVLACGLDSPKMGSQEYVWEGCWNLRTFCPGPNWSKVKCIRRVSCWTQQLKKSPTGDSGSDCP